MKLSVFCDPRYEFLIVPSSVVGGETAEHLWAAIFKRGVFCQTLMEEKNALFRIAVVWTGCWTGTGLCRGTMQHVHLINLYLYKRYYGSQTHAAST